MKPGDRRQGVGQAHEERRCGRRSARDGPARARDPHSMTEEAVTRPGGEDRGHVARG